MEISHTEGKKIWADYADKEGWINTSVNKVIEDLENEHDGDLPLNWGDLDFEKSLYSAHYFYDIEFETEDQERWRFI